MKTYGAVPTPLWDNPRYLALSPHAKFVLLYCLTGRHSTMLGCFRLPIQYIAGDSGLSLQEAEAALQEVIGQQFIVYDIDTSWLLIPEYLDWNTIDNPNQGINIAKQFTAVPQEISLYYSLIKVLQAHDKYFEEPFKAELAKQATLAEQGFSKPPLAEDERVRVTLTETAKKGLGNPSEETGKELQKDAITPISEVNKLILPESELPSAKVVSVTPSLDKQSEQTATNSATAAFERVRVTLTETTKKGLGNPSKEIAEPFRNQYQYQYQYQEQKQYQEQEQKEKTCAELAKDAISTPTPDVVITLPLVGNKEWAVHQQQVEEWQQLYPGIDVVQVLRNIKGWNLANPKRRKTKSGILRHVTSWLAKEQDRGGITVVQGGFSKPWKPQSLHENNLAAGHEWLAQRRVIDGEAAVCN